MGVLINTEDEDLEEISLRCYSKRARADLRYYRHNRNAFYIAKITHKNKGLYIKSNCNHGNSLNGKTRDPDLLDDYRNYSPTPLSYWKWSIERYKKSKGRRFYDRDRIKKIVFGG